jgi:hypothetical protein
MGSKEHDELCGEKRDDQLAAVLEEQNFRLPVRGTQNLHAGD